nr:MAG TPA: hypothetical protein [Bacteriophage sp.]
MSHFAFRKKCISCLSLSFFIFEGLSVFFASKSKTKRPKISEKSDLRRCCYLFSIYILSHF